MPSHSWPILPTSIHPKNHRAALESSLDKLGWIQNCVGSCDGLFLRVDLVQPRENGLEDAERLLANSTNFSIHIEQADVRVQQNTGAAASVLFYLS
jgi:hypothetical protein